MNDEAKTGEILAQLKTLLEQAKPDYSRILELSSELSTHDPQNVRFTADAGLLSRLGRELVARQETAVSELVKNAYDADATKARLIFQRTKKAGGTLVVWDNGTGMTRNQLLDGFMRLASNHKVIEPRSPLFGRERAGRKGIGRFATQRLGTKLELTTQTAGSPLAMKVTIDWTSFDHAKNLFAVPSKIREVKKERKQGTTLRISGLREAWTDIQIARIYRYVGNLLQPFPLSKRKKTRRRREADPGFKAAFFRRIKGTEVEVASEEQMVFDHAAAKVSANVDANGHATWRVTSARYGLDEQQSFGPSKDDAKKPFTHLRSVHLQAHYFIWSTELIPGQQYTRLRALADQEGGVRLYRNGFRVFPYGEPRNDWLGLDELYRRRSVLFPLSNTNWFGFVEITDPEGQAFQETSAREGLSENDHYQELVEFTRMALVNAATRVTSLRGVKITAGQRDFQSLHPRTSREQFEAAAGTLLQATESFGSGSRDSRDPITAETLRDATESAKALVEQGRLMLEENAMLRVLSSLGLTIGIFTHEIRHQLSHLRTQITDWLEKQSTEGKGRAASTLQTLDARLNLLQSYAAYFDAAISANVRRELTSQPITKVLFDFMTQFETAAKRDGAEFAGHEEIEEDLQTKPMHSSELTSVLGNLLTNSLKAIKRSKNRGHGLILIKAWRKDETIFVDFADNGDGVPEKNKERIFEAFFTTSNLSGTSADELTGTGLGLKIVYDILSALGGDIYLASPPKGYVTNFRLEIPADVGKPEV